MKTLVICGHPSKTSLNAALTEHYSVSALQGNHEVKTVYLSELKFNPILEGGYKTPTPLEPDLVQIQQDLLWAEHLVIFYPHWWSGPPALLKGFIDRVFLPGFAFKYHKNDPYWDKLLKGRAATIFITMDAPRWYDWLFNRSADINMMRRGILAFCGFDPIKFFVFDRVKSRKPEEIQAYFEKVAKLAKG